MTITGAEAQDDLVTRDGVRTVPVRPSASRDPAAIERLYGDHYRDVFRYVLGLTRSFDDAEEITAETFERAIRTWQEVPARPAAWFLLTARRLATDRWRRARRLKRILTLTAARRLESMPEPDSAFGEWFASVSTVLTAKQREVLILRYQRDLTDEDIGAVMGLTQSGVRSLAARALAVLRSHPELLR